MAGTMYGVGRYPFNEQYSDEKKAIETAKIFQGYVNFVKKGIISLCKGGLESKIESKE